MLFSISKPNRSAPRDIVYTVHILKFQVLNAAGMKMAVFWVFTACSLVQVNRLFRGKLIPVYTVQQPRRRPFSVSKFCITVLSISLFYYWYPVATLKCLSCTDAEYHINPCLEFSLTLCLFIPGNNGHESLSLRG
jgi:hypothetical protein